LKSVEFDVTIALKFDCTDIDLGFQISIEKQIEYIHREREREFRNSGQESGEARKRELHTRNQSSVQDYFETTDALHDCNVERTSLRRSHM
jgi:hypothetical protein